MPQYERKDRRDLTRPIWLFLLREGGRWTSSEIGKSIGLNTTTVCSSLIQQAERGLVRRHVPTEYGKQITYEVDDTCRIPEGLVLVEVTNALQAAGWNYPVRKKTA